MDDGMTITIDCPVICKVYVQGIRLVLSGLISLGFMIFEIIVLFSDEIIFSVPILLIVIKIYDCIKPTVLLGYIIMRIVTKYSDKYKWYMLIIVALIAISGLNCYFCYKGCQDNSDNRFLGVSIFSIFSLLCSLFFDFGFYCILKEYKKQNKEKRKKEYPNIDAPPVTDQTEPILPPPAFLDRNH